MCSALHTLHGKLAPATRTMRDFSKAICCGLEAGLGQAHKRAIGLASLYLPEE